MVAATILGMVADGGGHHFKWCDIAKGDYSPFFGDYFRSRFLLTKETPRIVLTKDRGWAICYRGLFRLV